MAVIALEDVLEVLRDEWLHDDPDGEANFQNAISNWNRKDEFWNAEHVAYYLELLDVSWPEERVKWINVASFEPKDILALANVDFTMRKCDICSDSYHVSYGDEFIQEYGVSREGGWSYQSASGNDVRVCNHCSVTNRSVGLFVS